MVFSRPSPGTFSQHGLHETLEIATKEVDNQMISDTKFAGLQDQLKINAYAATFSGMNDFDYPAISGVTSVSPLEKQLTTVKRVPLPDELSEQFTHMQCNCMMGIFPEINRAWLAIDSDIYFWVYEDGSDVAYYDGIKEVILSAGLIQPKEGVFQQHITYLLCISTPVNLYVLGVSFSGLDAAVHGNTHGSIQLHPEPLFTLTSDNVYMTSICGTANGRIFLAGKDSSLYEIVYQAQNSWFSNRCFKVNHSSSKLSFLIPTFLSFAFATDDPISQLAVDNSRGILYCRTSTGNIKVYSLGGERMDEMHFIGGVSGAHVAKQAQFIARTIDQRHFGNIVHIAPVPKTDSASVHLLAITEAGVRLYFTTSPLTNPYGSPCELKLVHVRMPPGFAPSSSPQKPSRVHTAFYRKGTSMLISGVSEDMDVLWCFSQDMYPFKATIKETKSVVQIDGHTWCLSEIPDYSNPSSVPCHLFNEHFPDPPAVVTQHALPTRRFILLSAQGSHIITTLRPLEQLRLLLYASGSGESDAIASYFQLFGVDQACATCLIIICQFHESEAELVDYATQAFFRYGGESKPQTQTIQSLTSSHPSSNPMSSYIVGSPIPGGSNQGSFLSTPVQQGYHKPLPTPAPPNLLNSTMVNQSALNAEKDNLISGKYSGLLLYFSRIMRPLWEYSMVHEISIDKHKTQLTSRLSSAELSWFTEQLYHLKKFIDMYSSVTASQTPTYIHRYSFVSEPGSTPQEIYVAEKMQLQAFNTLLTLSIEALELWRVLCDHQFHLVVDDAAADVKERLKIVSFKNMFSATGRELSTCLINLLMAKYLHNNSAVDTLSTQLREICPTLFSADDALYTKANEVILAAALVHNQTEKESMLQEAIMVYSKIPLLVDLTWVCNQLKLNHYYIGIVQLCLTIALKRDSLGTALHYYKTGEPRDDIEGMEAFAIRKEVYNCILKTFEELLHDTTAHPASPNLPSHPGPPVVSQTNALSPELAQKHFDSMFSSGLLSGDELFHVCLYEWLTKTQQSDRLLQIKSPFLEPYMIAVAAEQHPDNKNILDLLWKFYEKNNNFMAAAKVLMKLAEREGPSLTIHNRLEYLSRALMSTKSSNVSTVGVVDGDFLHEIEEKLDVARIQIKIFEQLAKSKTSSQHKDNALVELNSKLFDISALYGDYAEKFNLPECKLAIIHCANHGDINLVQRIWQELINKAFDESRGVDRRIQSISQQLVQYGKLYFQHEQYFPIYFLIFLLERKSCELHLDPRWVFTMFQDIGVSFSILFQEYNSLFRAKERVWQDLETPLHVLNVLSLLFQTFLDDPPHIQIERITLTRSLFEATTCYLVELESMNNNDQNVLSLLAKFKGIQAKLKRMM